jgi:hypothetical protein
MTNPRSIKLRISYALASVLCLVVFNLLHTTEQRRTMQRSYDQWFGELEPKLYNPALTGTPLPALAVQVDAPVRKLHLTLALTPTGESPLRERVLRIMQMAKEANLFSLQPRQNGEITFAIRSDAQNFSVSFDPKDIEGNAQAQAMLKLLQIYSVTPSEEKKDEEPR